MLTNAYHLCTMLICDKKSAQFKIKIIFLVNLIDYL
jgi:hypothetical protein